MTMVLFRSSPYSDGHSMSSPCLNQTYQVRSSARPMQGYSYVVPSTLYTSKSAFFWKLLLRGMGMLVLGILGILDMCIMFSKSSYI